MEQGALSSAFDKAEEGIRESAGVNPVWNWKFRVLKAELLLWETRDNEALQLLAATPPAELSEGEFAVRKKAIEGMALGYLRQDSEAEHRFTEAEELALKTAPRLQCDVLLYEGNYANKKQDFALAEQRFRKSLELASSNGDTFVEAGANTGLGIALTHLGRFDEAIESLSTSLKLTQSHKYRVGESLALNNLAWSYEELGDLAKAFFYFAEAEKAAAGLGQEKVMELISMNVGDVYLSRGNDSAARGSYLKALSILREMQRDKRTQEQRSIETALDNLAAVAVQQGNLEEAEGYFRESSDADPYFPTTMLISAKIAAARGRFDDAIVVLRQLLAPPDKRAPVHWEQQADSDNRFVRWDARADLAGIYALKRQSAQAEEQFRVLIHAIEAARSTLRIDENRLAFTSHSGRYYDDYVSFLSATGQKRKAFQVAEFSRARTLEEGVGIEAPKRPRDISIERIQTFLRQNKKDAILAYWLAAGQSFVWLISPAQFELFPIAPQHEIEQRVDEYNKLLQKIENAEELEEKGQSLYQTLVGRVEKLIPANARLVIIPDGGLSKLNFETLRAPHPSPHYWIDDVETEITSSTTLLISSKKREMVQRKLLLIGNPVLASSDYPPLTHAAEESQRVEAHFPKSEETVILGKDAIPSTYRASHPERFETIHFVTHGTAHELSPLESAIILSPESESVFKLYARDIVNIPIKADLVTISACYGLGKRAYSGEGLVGLAWAFLRAGAHQVVAGLWDVDDRASVDLMDDFYTGLKHQSAAAALRAAKLKMVRSTGVYRLPYYWASLQLYTGS